MLNYYTVEKRTCQTFFPGNTVKSKQKASQEVFVDGPVKTLHNFIHNQWITCLDLYFFNISKFPIACG